MSAHIAMQFTPTPESADATFGRDVQVHVALHETADGGITIDLRMNDDAGQGLGLAALVFDFADHELLAGLSLTGPRLRGQNFSAGRVRATGDAARGFDCGASFCRAQQAQRGRAPRDTAVHLAHDSLSITLDDLAGRAFALHLVPTAANHAPCAGFVIEGCLPARPARRDRVAASTDGSVFGGVFDEFVSRLAAPLGNAA
ncbi:hypothetical protein [Limimaricola hongkongensis]|uniref:Uncharacterized protein n=1 Tax=Limimaricola hongkongensis DSM 17492 TaxID=1122180 RepID=A0A017HDK5_9RHOB|nr:hypothetical protein [Limimaricola hongkongensis]EYD72446.1 hypothetical protein Lokhon_01245 [Limimaricola hongkongensis DSM 17492]